MKGKKKNQFNDDDYDLLLQMNEEETPATTTSEPVVATAEDEWPEDIPKKSKKNNKGSQSNTEKATIKDHLEIDSQDKSKNAVDENLNEIENVNEKVNNKEKNKAKNKDKDKDKDKENKSQEIPEDIPGPKLLSKKEKEKLKKQRQKETEKSKAAKLLDSIPDSIDDEETIKPISKTSSKKKAPSATIALLQKMMEEQRAAEEAERLRLEEEKRKQEEEARRREEEERLKEEERRLKKEKEKARKEQLKKEGKLLTKAQKEKELRNRQRLEQLLASGVRIAGLVPTDANGDENASLDTQPHSSQLHPTATPPLKESSRQQKKKPPHKKFETNNEEESSAVNGKILDATPSVSSDVAPDVSITRKKENDTQHAQKQLGQQKNKDKNQILTPQQTLKGSIPTEKKKGTLALEEPSNMAEKEEEEDIKECWEDESDEEKETRHGKHLVGKVKSAWDESSDEDKDDEEEIEEMEKRQTKKAVKQVKQIRDVSLERKSPKPSSEKCQKSTPPLNLVEPEKKPQDTANVKKKRQGEKELPSNKSTSPSTSPSSPEPTPTSSTSSKSGTQKKEKPKPTFTAGSAAQDLRSPICCILGHVDTGKTKLLDKIRQTNVQDSEAGGITQQIGATYFPVDAIQKKIQVLDNPMEIKVPGLLIIDTPGHESFTNLRSRGSSLCNMAILVVDIMHGLEPQTLESLNLLRQRKTPFIVALNKIDRMYDWKAIPNNSFVDSIKHQSRAVHNEFEKRLNEIILAFAEQGLNARLYSENENMGKYVSIVPTSAITGEGIPDMLYLLIHLTQTRMSEKIKYVGELEATVLEVKVVEGLGTTIDVILSNGVLNESDTIVVCGLEGPIVTHIRALLTPQPMRELRVKSQYIHHKQIKAAMGVKISANGLDKAIAGSRLLVLKPDDDEEELREEVMEDLQHLLASVDKSGKGVWVQASTLGSLEALLSFLKSSEIPVAGMHIGPVHKKDVMKASIMLERAKEYAVMLCFDVKIDKDAQDLADEMGVKVFKADIIYHLFDQFTAYYQELVELRRKDAMPEAVFPCILKMVPDCLFNKRDPIIMGVDVVEGVLRIGTPICVLNEEKKPISLGKVTSIEHNRKSIEIVKKGHPSVAIKIECPSYEHPKMYGRHFDEKSEFYSMISRQSIDILKENFKHEMERDYWVLIVRLKGLFGII